MGEENVAHNVVYYDLVLLLPCDNSKVPVLFIHLIFSNWVGILYVQRSPLCELSATRLSPPSLT